MAFELKQLRDNQVLHSGDVTEPDINRKQLWENTSTLNLPAASATMTEWCFDGIRIMHSNWIHKEPGAMAWKSDLEIVGLQFMLQGKYSMQVSPAHQPLNFSGNQHNMLYMNSASGELKSEASGTRFFMLQFAKDAFLQLTEGANETLQRFAEKVLKGEPTFIADHNLGITLPMQQAIQAIIHCPYQNGIKKLFLLSKAIEILVLQAELFHQQMQQTKKVLRTSYDRERIVFVRDHLLQHLDNPPGLSELARMAGLNEYKLKHGFRELFNTTAFGFVAEKRLELALSYLRDTDHSIGDIASMLGYSSIQHFSNAFKKKFGVSPNKGR